MFVKKIGQSGVKHVDEKSREMKEDFRNERKNEVPKNYEYQFYQF